MTSTDPDDDLREYLFNFGNMKHIVVEKPGELWVYVQRNAKLVTVSRQGYVPIRRYDLKTTIEAGKTYVMQLSPQARVVYTQMVHFSITPADSRAVVMVKSSEAGAEEFVFGTTDQTGGTARNLPYGTYTYKVYADNYHNSEGRFTLNNKDETHVEKVTLRPNFAVVTLQATSEADIFVNGEKKGRGQWSGRLTAGSYQVECRQEGHRPSSEAITVEENVNRTITLTLPTPIFGVLAVISEPLGANISIDGKSYGMTPRNIELVIGKHSVTLSKDGYASVSQVYEIKENETVEASMKLSEVKNTTDVAKNTTVVPMSSTSKTGTQNGHDWVDLGLSVRWATTNVGASSPEDYGDYFAWGEATAKSDYSWSTYKYCNGSYDTQTKYCTNSSYGTVDNKTTLESSDDAATVNWGGKWRMPTYDELSELNTKCTWTWTTQNGVNGYKVTGPNGNSIFLPAAGYRYGTGLSDAGSNGYYWSSSLYTSDPYNARGLYFNSSGHGMDGNDRDSGFSVRPVTEP